MLTNMEEDEMTFEELQAVMLSGEKTTIEPGPTVVHGHELTDVGLLIGPEMLEATSSFHLTCSTFGAVPVTVGSATSGGKPQQEARYISWGHQRVPA